jgi:hypothetical protein
MLGRLGANCLRPVQLCVSLVVIVDLMRVVYSAEFAMTRKNWFGYNC